MDDKTYLFLAGGAVRDLLLGQQPSDLDFAFSGTLADFERNFPAAYRVGRSVDVWILDCPGLRSLELRPLEIRPLELRPLFNNSIEADLLHRDFTINALLLAENGRLHAHPQALDDLRAKILRPASDNTFHNDPARLFRLARFAAWFPDFSIAPETWTCLPDQAQLTALPAERVGRELQKALAAPRPSRFLDVLRQAKAFLPWFAELALADAVPAGPLPWHERSVLGHLGEVMDKCAPDPLAVWLALCHDLGKLGTRPEQWPRHHGHDKRGSGPARNLAQRLRLPEKYSLGGAIAAREHMKAAQYGSLRPATRLDLLLQLDRPELFTSFWRLIKADSGLDWQAQARQDLERVKAIRLPAHQQNQGEKSGLWLRQLRLEALSASNPDPKNAQKSLTRDRKAD